MSRANNSNGCDESTTDMMRNAPNTCTVLYECRIDTYMLPRPKKRLKEIVGNPSLPFFFIFFYFFHICFLYFGLIQPCCYYLCVLILSLCIFQLRATAAAAACCCCFIFALCSNESTLTLKNN